ncbi:F-box domain containing protein [Tanacetum coccineum]
MLSSMKNERDESGDCSLFSHLPDELVLLILRKLIDFKTLCFCKLVCKRFNQIVLHVDTIFLTVPLIENPSFNSNTLNESSDPFLSGFKSLLRFQGLKSLHIEVPPSLSDAYNKYFFKWKFMLGEKIDSFVFLSPNSVCDTKENVQDEEDDLVLAAQKRCIALHCLMNALFRRKILLATIDTFPLLEKVSITDSGKRGRVSHRGENIVELRNWLSSPPESLKKEIECHCQLSRCYVPFLELPVSGYVMKGVTLILLERYNLGNDKNDSFMKSDDHDDNCMNNYDDDYVFEDNEEAAYREAVMEIFKKHRVRMERL